MLLGIPLSQNKYNLIIGLSVTLSEINYFLGKKERISILIYLGFLGLGVWDSLLEVTSADRGSAQGSVTDR